jgi:hypothetical protein
MMLAGTNGLKFQSASGLGAMWTQFTIGLRRWRKLREQAA